MGHRNKRTEKGKADDIGRISGCFSKWGRAQIAESKEQQRKGRRRNVVSKWENRLAKLNDGRWKEQANQGEYAVSHIDSGLIVP